MGPAEWSWICSAGKPSSCPKPVSTVYALAESRSELAGARPEELHLLCKTVVSATDKPVVASIFPDCNTEALELADAAVSAGPQPCWWRHLTTCSLPNAKAFGNCSAVLRKQLPVPLLLSNCIQTAQVELTSIVALINEGWLDGIHQAGGNAHLLADVLRLNPRVPVCTGVEDLIYLALVRSRRCRFNAGRRFSGRLCCTV